MVVRALRTWWGVQCTNKSWLLMLEFVDKLPFSSGRVHNAIAIVCERFPTSLPRVGLQPLFLARSDPKTSPCNGRGAFFSASEGKFLSSFP